MKNSHKRLIAVAVITLAAGLLLYRDAVMKVYTAVITRDDSSHGIFVPFMSAYFLWLKRDKLKSIRTRTDYFGIFFMLPAIAAAVLKIGSFHIQFLAFLVFIAGLIFFLFGKAFLKDVSFPLFFLAGMIPFPEESYITIANISRHIAFDGALKIISIFGIPYFREGWVLHLPNAVLEVAIGCSGIRYLISYVVFGIAYAYLMKNTTRARIATVALTIPISVVASNLRLAFIFLATYYISPYWSQPRPHILISWAVFFGILILSISIDQYFQKRWEAKKLGGEEAEKRGGFGARKERSMDRNLGR